MVDHIVDASERCGRVDIRVGVGRRAPAAVPELILTSSKIVVDETVVLDPGRGRTKKGYFWAVARDNRPWV